MKPSEHALVLIEPWMEELRGLSVPMEVKRQAYRAIVKTTVEYMHRRMSAKDWSQRLSCIIEITAELP